MLRSSLFLLLLCSVLLCDAMWGQSATGVDPLESYGGGPFDTVNLSNLDVHFGIPVVAKAGRGTPFHYTLSYDSQVWGQVLVNGTTTWSPVANWG